VLREEEVPALLTAEACAGAAKLLCDMTIADLRSFKCDPCGREASLNRCIREDGHHDTICTGKPPLLTVECEQGDQDVAVDWLTALIDCDTTVGISIERDPSVSASFTHGSCKGGRACCTDSIINHAGARAQWRDNRTSSSKCIKYVRRASTVCSIHKDRQGCSV
jgi:hypothetical protein